MLSLHHSIPTKIKMRNKIRVKVDGYRVMLTHSSIFKIEIGFNLNARIFNALTKGTSKITLV